MKNLVLRFWGNEKFPSAAVPFEIKDLKKAKKIKRSTEEIIKLEGTFKHDNDEDEFITHKNCKFIDSSPPVGEILSS